MSDVRKLVKPKPMWCHGCRSAGAFHCAHPDQCGHMLTATDAADHWKAWIDDLPLPEGFKNASGRLQDFITALACLADMPHPLQPALTPASDGRAEGLREAGIESRDYVRGWNDAMMAQGLEVIDPPAWQPPPESERPEGFKCIGAVEVTWWASHGAWVMSGYGGPHGTAICPIAFAPLPPAPAQDGEP